MTAARTTGAWKGSAIAFIVATSLLVVASIASADQTRDDTQPVPSAPPTSEPVVAVGSPPVPPAPVPVTTSVPSVDVPEPVVAVGLPPLPPVPEPSVDVPEPVVAVGLPPVPPAPVPAVGVPEPAVAVGLPPAERVRALAPVVDAALRLIDACL